MPRILLLLTIALFSCAEATPEVIVPRTVFMYSTQPDIEAPVSAALDLINAVAGCELVLLVEPGDYVTPIIAVDEHYFGEAALGCAFLNSALYAEEEAADLIIDDVVIEMSEAGASTLLVHEIGHTLGIGHTEAFGFMFPSWREDGNFYQLETVYYLRDLCAAQEFWAEG